MTAFWSAARLLRLALLDLVQAQQQFRWQAAANRGVDQAHGEHVGDMDAVDVAAAGELHADQRGAVDDEEPLGIADGLFDGGGEDGLGRAGQADLRTYTSPTLARSSMRPSSAMRCQSSSWRTTGGSKQGWLGSASGMIASTSTFTIKGPLRDRPSISRRTLMGLPFTMLS